MLTMALIAFGSTGLTLLCILFCVTFGFERPMDFLFKLMFFNMVALLAFVGAFSVTIIHYL
jgi:hypothetical protein